MASIYEAKKLGHDIPYCQTNALADVNSEQGQQKVDYAHQAQRDTVQSGPPLVGTFSHSIAKSHGSSHHIAIWPQHSQA